MYIDLSTIPPEGLEVKEQEPVNIIDIKEKDIEFKVPVNIHFTANLASNTLLVRGTIDTEAVFSCSRCLSKFTVKLNNNNFSFEKDVKGLKKIDITNDLREGIVVVLPLKPLCVEYCKGLCLKCGQNLNIKECGCNRKPENIKWKELDKLKPM